MKLPAAAWQRREGMKPLLAALGAEGGRDPLSSAAASATPCSACAVSDVDLATRLPPEEVMERLAKARIKAVPTGLAHGTVTAVVAGEPVEVTTLRRDVATDGRRATIAYTDDWREDAARRDFTINALFADPATPRGPRLFRRRGRSRGAPRPLHRRSADPDRRGSSAHPALLPLPRPLRRGRAGRARRSTPAPRAPTT